MRGLVAQPDIGRTHECAVQYFLTVRGEARIPSLMKSSLAMRCSLPGDVCVESELLPEKKILRGEGALRTRVEW